MRVSFCGLELDDERRELSRGGRPLAVEPRVFDLLSYLVRQRGRLVRKDELLERLWPASDVQEGALSVCVHRARRLLDGDGAAAIRTVARRGYRFEAPVCSLPLAPGRFSTDGFVGRSEILSSLSEDMRHLAASGLRTFELVGEAGVGKTALLEELGTTGRRMRLEVLKAAPSGAEDPPLSVWAEVIAAYMARYDARSVRRAMGREFDIIASFVPSMRRWASPDCDRSGAEPQHRATALARSIREATAGRPVLLLFDDLDRADAGSVALLGQVLGLCREVPALIGLACREASGQLAPALDAMRALPGHRRFALSGLGRAELSALLELRDGCRADEVLVDRLLRETRGNPREVEGWLASRAGPVHAAAAEESMSVRVP